MVFGCAIVVLIDWEKRLADDRRELERLRQENATLKEVEALLTGTEEEE